jgi:gas vesicle protein
MNIKKVLLSVLAGAATGVTLGVLFAPHKGKSTRRRIMSEGESYISKMKQIMDGYISMINERVENLKVEITDMSHNGKAKVDETMSDLIHTKIK